MSYVTFRGHVDIDSLENDIYHGWVTKDEALEALEAVIAELQHVRRDIAKDACDPCECCDGCRNHY